MGEINRALGEAGAGCSLEIGGEMWILSWPTKGMQAKYEDWLERRARKAALAWADDLDEDAYQGMLARVNGEIAAGKYTFGQPACLAAMKTADGFLELMRLLLEPKHPRITTEKVRQLLEADPHGWVATIQSMFPAEAKKEGPEGNGPAPPEAGA